MERELEWLEANKEAALAADSWKGFCDSQGEAGKFYRKYGWLERQWEFLKERGFLLLRPVTLPKVRKFEELFSEVRLLPRDEDKLGMRYLSGTASICGSFGGKRGTRPDGVRTHYGGTFHSAYVRPKFSVPDFFGDPNVYIEAVRRTDGILVVARANRIIASEWIALVEPSEELERLLPKGDRELLQTQREAEAAAWPAA